VADKRIKASWWILANQEGFQIPPKVFHAAYFGLHVLFGPNNSGKSRILRGLGDAIARIEIPWENAVSYGGENFRLVRELARSYSVQPLTLDYTKHNRELNLIDECRQSLLQFSNQLGSRLELLMREIQGSFPVIKEQLDLPIQNLFIKAHRFLKSTAPIGSNDGNPDDPDQMVLVLSRLQGHQDPLRRKRFERIQSAFFGISGTKFSLRQDKEWTVHISEDDFATERPLDQCGDGLRDLLGLILRLEDDPSRHVFIDEPGVRLHPHAQRNLLRYLHISASNRPIWIATHDGVFIGSPDVMHRYAISRKDGITTAQRVKSPQEARSAFGELGWSPRDALLCDTILFCEGPSDRVAFVQILEEPGHASFQGVEVVQLGGDRIWGKDTARLKSLVSAVKAVAPHARFVALLDRGGHSESECQRVAHVLDEHDVKTAWLPEGELEEFWLGDVDSCVKICISVATSLGIDIPLNTVNNVVTAELAIRSSKASEVMRKIFEQLQLQFSKTAIANAAASLIAQDKLSSAKAAIIKVLVDVIPV
jgi:hypothetical protein